VSQKSITSGAFQGKAVHDDLTSGKANIRESDSLLTALLLDGERGKEAIVNLNTNKAAVRDLETTLDRGKLFVGQFLTNGIRGYVGLAIFGFGFPCIDDFGLTHL
jgi:hypothetical protein